MSTSALTAKVAAARAVKTQATLPTEWLPCPLVDWTQLATSIAPGKPATRARLRTLRAKKHLSDGVKITHRGATGVAGASSYYSVLSLWAERARGRGFDEDAATLSAAASALEEEFAQPLKDYLSRCAFEDLPGADFFWLMANKTAVVLTQTKTWQDAVVAVASVTAVDDHVAHLQGTSMGGEPRTVDLPRHLVESNSLREGSCVFVLSQVFGAGAFVEVHPAVPSHRMWLEGVRSGCFAADALPHTRADEHAGDPEPAAVDRDHPGDPRPRDYNAGPGAAPTRELADFAWNAVLKAGQEPTPLRPAG